jgi:phospholipid transport system substrate-binding protein
MRLTLLLVGSTVTAIIIPALNPVGVLAQSVPPNAASNSNQAVQTPAVQFIQDIGNRATAVMADKSLVPEQRMQKYREILRDSFDMETIGHFVLGRSWGKATPEQRQTFLQLFEQIVLETYGDRLNFYSGETFHVKGTRRESDKDTVVSSEILHTNGSQPTSIDWRIRDVNGKVAIIDVIIEGVSQSVTQRQEYLSIIQRNNGNIDGLLDKMRQHLQQPPRAP